MRASEVMIADPVAAAAGATSSEVAALMRVKNISVVPVVDNPKDRQYLGTISDRDLAPRYWRALGLSAAGGRRVGGGKNLRARPCRQHPKAPPSPGHVSRRIFRPGLGGVFGIVDDR